MNTYIKFTTWNIENFVKINEIIEDKTLRDKLKENDIIFLQEWKNDKGEGTKFIEYLNTRNQEENGTSTENTSLAKNFTNEVADRCCIIYDTSKFVKVEREEENTKFELTLPKGFRRSLTERTYIRHRTYKALNLVLQLKEPINILINENPVAVSYLNLVSFHLAAFVPKHHKKDRLHQHQMNIVLNHVKNENDRLTKNDRLTENDRLTQEDNNTLIILAGDTNYRVVDDIELLDSKPSLKEALINKKETDLFKGLIEENDFVNKSIITDLNLRDIYHIKSVESTQVFEPTQSFTSVHEKGIGKDVAKKIAKHIKTCKESDDINDKNCSYVSRILSKKSALIFDDARLDLVITNADTNTPVEITKTNYSDHYILESSIKPFIIQVEGSIQQQGGKKKRKPKTKKSNKKRKSRKNKKNKNKTMKF